jgi:hypothetical protein
LRVLNGNIITTLYFTVHGRINYIIIPNKLYKMIDDIYLLNISSTTTSQTLYKLFVSQSIILHMICIMGKCFPLLANLLYTPHGKRAGITV